MRSPCDVIAVFFFERKISLGVARFAYPAIRESERRELSALLSLPKCAFFLSLSLSLLDQKLATLVQLVVDKEVSEKHLSVGIMRHFKILFLSGKPILLDACGYHEDLTGLAKTKSMA